MSLFIRYREAFAGLPRQAWLLAAVVLINTSGTMVLFFMSLYLTRHLGWPANSAGLGMSGFGVGMLAGTLTGGFLSDRLGAFRIQRVSLTGAGLLLVSIAFLRSRPAVLAAIVTWGFVSSALFPANAAAMAAVCPPAVRARGFVLNRLAANLGATIGPLVGGFLAQVDYRLLFWVDGATSLLAALAALLLFPDPRLAASPETPVPSAAAGTRWWRDGRFGALLAVTIGTALIISQIFSTFGVYLKDAGLTESKIGGLIAVNTGLIVLLQMPLVHGTAHLSRTRLTAAGALLLGVGFAMTPYGAALPYLAFTVVVWTFGEMLTLPLLTTLVSLRAPAAAQGRYQGLFTMSYSLGVTLGPTLGTWTYTAVGGHALWAGVGGTGALVAAAMLLLSFSWDGNS
jgi:MFS family permease